MTVRIEKKGRVWTVIHSRPQARNAMDPESADALVDAFTAFDRDAGAAVAVLWGEGGAFCAGWDLKYCGSLIEDPTPIHEIDYPLDDRQPIRAGRSADAARARQAVIAAVADRRSPRIRAGAVVRRARDGEVGLLRCVLPALGVPLIDGGTVRLPRIVGMGARSRSSSPPQGSGRRGAAHRRLRARRRRRRIAQVRRGDGA